jgi:hypothetical protein
MAIQSYAVVATTAGTYYGVSAAVGEVANVIMWDGGTEWAPPTGTEAVAVGAGIAVEIGWTFSNGTFSAPA